MHALVIDSGGFHMQLQNRPRIFLSKMKFSINYQLHNSLQHEHRPADGSRAQISENPMTPVSYERFLLLNSACVFSLIGRCYKLVFHCIWAAFTQCINTQMSRSLIQFTFSQPGYIGRSRKLQNQTIKERNHPLIKQLTEMKGVLSSKYSNWFLQGSVGRS